jgi:hypothetical protein
MNTRTVETKFYEFDQNNSGGSFDVDEKRGIGVNVWIEALSVEDANDRAERIGIYFNGCEAGQDCECCGDRWSPAWNGSGKDSPNFRAGDYVHYLDGSFKKIAAAQVQP